MFKKSLSLSVFILLLTLILFAGICYAVGQETNDDPVRILAGMDQVTNGYADQEMDLSLEVVDTNGHAKKYDMNIQQFGSEKRLVSFTSGELKGMRMLTLDRNRVWVYLPGYKRVRRVAAHNLRQTIAGSDFTNEDMAAAGWVSVCKPSLKDQNETTWFLRCDPKEEDSFEAHHLIFSIEKDGYYQSGVEYYNAQGKVYKRMVSSDLQSWTDGIKRYRVITMENVFSGHKTNMILKKFAVNQGYKDSMFTVRKLKWGR